MKKAAILLMLATGLSFTAQAQEQAIIQPQEQFADRTEEYLSVSVYGNVLRKKLEVHLDSGEGEGSRNYIRDANGQKQEFPSVVAVMNHLNAQGWEFVNFIPDSDGKTDYRRFLMKRKIAPKS